jgi:hypothetical protein
LPDGVDDEPAGFFGWLGVELLPEPAAPPEELLPVADEPLPVLPLPALPAGRSQP